MSKIRVYEVVALTGISDLDSDKIRLSKILDDDYNKLMFSVLRKLLALKKLSAENLEDVIKNAVVSIKNFIDTEKKNIIGLLGIYFICDFSSLEKKNHLQLIEKFLAAYFFL